MTRTETRRLRQKCNHLRRLAAGHDYWIKRNFARCGHSNTANGLGDEGWNEAHRRGGIAAGLTDAAAAIEGLLNKIGAT